MTTVEEQPQKRRLGFAAMSPEQRRELSIRGGKASQEGGNAYRWTRETAAEAGRIGGMNGRNKTKHRSKQRSVEQSTTGE